MGELLIKLLLNPPRNESSPCYLSHRRSEKERWSSGATRRGAESCYDGISQKFMTSSEIKLVLRARRRLNPREYLLLQPIRWRRPVHALYWRGCTSGQVFLPLDGKEVSSLILYWSFFFENDKSFFKKKLFIIYIFKDFFEVHTPRFPFYQQSTDITSTSWNPSFTCTKNPSQTKKKPIDPDSNKRTVIGIKY